MALVAVPATILAQDVPFDGDVVARCVAEASNRPALRACIGPAADACIAG
jgi:hypothetical protein